MMVSNSTNINKMNNHLSPQIIVHRSDHDMWRSKFNLWLVIDRHKNVAELHWSNILLEYCLSWQKWDIVKAYVSIYTTTKSEITKIHVIKWLRAHYSPYKRHANLHSSTCIYFFIYNCEKKGAYEINANYMLLWW